MRHRLRLLTLFALTGLAACAPEGPSAFVTFNLKPPATCVFTRDASSIALPTGLYDISGALKAADNDDPQTVTDCARPYYVHLQVNSFLRSNSDAMLGRAEPNILQLDRAEVRLMDLQKRTIVFGSGANQLFNPFLVTTNDTLTPASDTSASLGIATVEAIPVAYASFLKMFTGQQILAEVQIFGSTTGDVDIDFKPFVYPIEICKDCLRRCVDSLDDPDSFTKDDECNDNAGADGRACVDTKC